MEYGYKEPVYTIGIVSKALKVCPATLRIWKRKGLIKPTRLGKNRFYSKCEMDRLEYIKELLQKKHINIEGGKTDIRYNPMLGSKEMQTKGTGRLSGLS